MSKKCWIENKRGLRLAAVVESPSWERPSPFSLLLHGFKGYKEEATYTELAKALMAKGIGSIRFDASGFGESEGTLEKDYRLSNYCLDAESVYDYILQQTYVDKTRVGVCGQSLGGLQAIVFASKYPELKAMVSISPPNILGEDGELSLDVGEWKKTGYLNRISSKYGKIKVPYAFLTDAQKFVGAEYAQKVKDQMAKGSEEGVSGTPGTIIIDAKGQTQLVPGALPFEQIKPMIDAALKQ